MFGIWKSLQHSGSVVIAPVIPEYFDHLVDLIQILLPLMKWQFITGTFKTLTIILGS